MLKALYVTKSKIRQDFFYLIDKKVLTFFLRKHSEALGGIPVVQLTQEAKVVKKSEGGIYHISASRFFS